MVAAGLLGALALAVLALLAWEPRREKVDSQQTPDAVVLNELDGTCRELLAAFTSTGLPPVTTPEAVSLVAGRRADLFDRARDRLAGLRPSKETVEAVRDLESALAQASVAVATAAALSAQGISAGSLEVLEKLEDPVVDSFAAAADAGATSCRPPT